ncbi:MAG: oxidoreductase [Gemmatimonadales bacterium]|nr:MAG: oxidoreductase [Gemmatimonadales bacterium]
MTGAELWTTAAVFGPLLASLVALGGRPAALKAGLLLGSVTTLAGSLGLWLQVLQHGPVRHLLGGWGAPLGIELWADGFSVVMLAVTALVGAAVSLYSLSYFGDLSTLDAETSPAGRAARYFVPLWLLLWSALNGIYLSADLFNLYVTLEILGLAAAALVTLAVTPRATVAGMRYLIVSLVGSMLFLLGVALLYTEFGTLALEELSAAAPGGPMAATSLALMTVGMAAKTALFPLHAWLPPAHAGAPAPASALLSAVVVKGSFFILVRLWFAVYGGGSEAGLVLMGGLGAAAILWGSVLALRQRSLKRVIAYSTVAQLGYMFVMFPLLAPEGLGGPDPRWSDDAWIGGILLAVSHALAKASMFMAAGNMSYAVARDGLRDISGVAHRLPMSFLAFGLGGLSLAGLPPSAGFVGKWLLLREALSAGGWFWVAIITVGGLLTIAYVLKVLRHALDREASDGDFRPVPRRMEWAALLLALASASLGVRATEVFQVLLQGGVQPWT